MATKRISARRLTSEQVIEVRKRYRNGETMETISHDYNMTKASLKSAIRGVTYREVPGYVGTREVHHNQGARVMRGLCLIWSNEHKAWWKWGAAGYTRDINEAGQYRLADALHICRKAMPGSPSGVPNELPIRMLDLHNIGAINTPTEGKR